MPSSRPTGRVRAALAALVLACTTSCGAGGGAPAVSRVTVTPGPISHAAQLTIDLPSASDVERAAFTVRTRPGGRSADVHVTLERSYLVRTGALAPEAGALRLPVFGLYADAANDVRVDVAFADGSTWGEDLVVATPPEVQALLPDLRVERAEPGLDVQFLLLQGHQPAVVLDIDGAIRWRGPDTGQFVFARCPTRNGLLVGSLQSPALYHVDWLGTYTESQLSDPRCVLSHHDIVPGKVGYLDTVTWIDGDVYRPHSVLVEMLESGEILRRWDFDEIFRSHIEAHGEDASDLVADARNWFHMNSAIYDPSDDSIIASSRENFVVKVDYTTGAIRWLLGHPGKAWFTAHPQALQPWALQVTGLPPIGQHALSVSPDGRLLTLFDNGQGNLDLPDVGDTRGWSRVVQYLIDPEAMTAEEVWVHDAGRTRFTPYCSSAVWTPAGHLLAVYSTLPDDEPARFEIVDRDHVPLFEAQLASGQCGIVYAAAPFALEALTLR